MVPLKHPMPKNTPSKLLYIVSCYAVPAFMSAFLSSPLTKLSILYLILLLTFVLTFEFSFTEIISHALLIHLSDFLAWFYCAELHMLSY